MQVDRILPNGSKAMSCIKQWTFRLDHVNIGVPQGSVLGPILFTVYVNDINNGIACKILKFADDAKILNTVTSEAQC